MIPHGAIIPSLCDYDDIPTSFVRETSFDSRYIKATISNFGNTGGNNNHTHTSSHAHTYSDGHVHSTGDLPGLPNNCDFLSKHQDDPPAEWVSTGHTHSCGNSGVMADGASGISNSDITLTNQRAFIQSFSGFYTLTYAASTALDFNNGNKQKITLTGNVTFTSPTNMNIGDFIKIEVAQDGTGGRSVTWFSGITWLSPDTSLNTNSGKKSAFVIEKTGANTYNGYLVGKEY